MPDKGVRQVTVDFEGVEVGGGVASVRVPEGDYGFRITKVQTRKGKDSGQPNLLFSLKAIKGPAKGIGKTLPHNCSLQKQSLWNLRNLIESCGKAVPSKAVKLDLDKMVGWELGGTVVDDEYEGKTKSAVTAFFPMSDLSLDAAPATNTKTKTKDTEPAEESEETEGDDSLEGGEEEEELF